MKRYILVTSNGTLTSVEARNRIEARKMGFKLGVRLITQVILSSSD